MNEEYILTDDEKAAIQNNLTPKERFVIHTPNELPPGDPNDPYTWSYEKFNIEVDLENFSYDGIACINGISMYEFFTGGDWERPLEYGYYFMHNNKPTIYFPLTCFNKFNALTMKAYGNCECDKCQFYAETSREACDRNVKKYIKMLGYPMESEHEFNAVFVGVPKIAVAQALSQIFNRDFTNLIVRYMW